MEQESQKREAEETDFRAPNIPTLCANNCGFFGSSATNNLCSKCYKNSFLSKSKASLADPALASVAPGAVVPVPDPPLPAIESNRVEKKPRGDEEEVRVNSLLEEGNPSGEGSVAKKHANRCSFCNKRVGLMGFNCRCGDMFCSVHRYSDKHNCLFDYKGTGQDAIAQANPIVKADKVDKI